MQFLMQVKRCPKKAECKLHRSPGAATGILSPARLPGLVAPRHLREQYWFPDALQGEVPR